jgi:hypothetical protein
MLALAKGADSSVVARIDEEMKPADSLHGDDLAGANGVRRRKQGVVAATNRSCEIASPKLKLRTAIGTGIGLRVEAPVFGVVVFGLAGRTHFETTHRRVHAVVGQRLDDAETRAAVRAVGEGVSVAAV